VRGNLDGGRAEYSHDLFTEFALEFVRTNRNQPFFLYLAWCTPHVRFEVPDLGPYAAGKWGSAGAEVYAAMVTRMDRDIGRLVASSTNYLEDDTLFFVRQRRTVSVGGSLTAICRSAVRRRTV
jgi:arylsulfatase A-like enzyme